MDLSWNTNKNFNLQYQTVRDIKRIQKKDAFDHF